jgi:hypothetical protein
MFYFVIAGWIVGCIVNFIHGNVKLPSVILVLGVAATAAQFTIGLGYGYIVIMAVLNIIIWFSNKLETI